MTNTRKLSLSYIRYMKDRNWRNFQQCKSILEGLLNDLAKKSEEELTKHDLLGLVSANCDYMRSLSLYNYYKDLLTLELTKDNESEDDGVIF